MTGGRPPDPRNVALATLKALSERVENLAPEHLPDVVEAHNALYRMLATSELEKEALGRISQVETSINRLNNINALDSQNLSAKGLDDVIGKAMGGDMFRQRIKP